MKRGLKESLMRYNTPNTPLDTIRDLVTRGGVPITMTLLIISVLTFFSAFFSPYVVRPLFEHYLLFTGGNLLVAPWTVVTYPVFEPSVFPMILGGIFFWLSGGSLERSWGSQRYIIFLTAITAISALSVLLGGLLFHQPPPRLDGFYMPLGAIIVAFCMLNPEQTVRLYFFPVRAKYVAVIVTVMTLLSYGPIFGVFACGGIIAAFLYVKFGRSWGNVGSYSTPSRTFRGPDLRMDTRPQRPTFRTTLDGSPRERSAMDIAGRVKDWQERRRLERLWKNSGLPDSEPDWRDDEKRRR